MRCQSRFCSNTPTTFTSCSRTVPRRCLNRLLCKSMLTVDVAVVGGGPAGLAAAVALQRANPGLKVHVFERTSMKARGAAVLVGVNGLLALKAIDGQLVENMLSKAIKLEGSDRYNLNTGDYIESLPMRNEIYKEQYGFNPSLLGWADITDALKAALPADSISINSAITGYKQLPDNTIQLLGPANGSSSNGNNNNPASSSTCASSSGSSGSNNAADSSSSGASTPSSQQQQQQQQPVVAICKALVGADGWFSQIREQLLADGPPTFKNAVVFRARINRPNWMPEQRTRWWVPGKGPSIGDELAVLIPVPGGDLVWQCHCPMDVFTSKGLTFNPVTGEAASSHADNTSSRRDGSNNGQSAKKRCLRAFDHLPAVFTDVVASTPESAITEHGLYQRTPEQIPDDKWGAGMVTLVGDAAHTAFVDGTGLALGLEDAAVLGWHVQQQGLTEAALRAFEAERIPRVKAVFNLTTQQAAAMARGVSQKELMTERAALLYGQAHFKPLKTLHSAV